MLDVESLTTRKFNTSRISNNGSGGSASTKKLKSTKDIVNLKLVGNKRRSTNSITSSSKDGGNYRKLKKKSNNLRQASIQILCEDQVLMDFKSNDNIQRQITIDVSPLDKRLNTPTNNNNINIIKSTIKPVEGRPLMAASPP